jgi:hypothetical protein
MIINNQKIYYAFRFISWVVIPVFSALWYIISGILHTHTPSPVVGVIIAIDAYLGIALQISSARYQKKNQKRAGYIVRSDNEEKRTFTLELEMDPEEFQHEDELVFKMRAL